MRRNLVVQLGLIAVLPLPVSGVLSPFIQHRDIVSHRDVVWETVPRPQSPSPARRAFADRVIALEDGQVVLDGTPRQVLTSDRMDAIGVVVPRYTQAARAGREDGLWRGGELPVTLEQASEGFSPKRSRLPREDVGER